MNKDEFLAEYTRRCKEAIGRVKKENPLLDRHNMADLIKGRDLLNELWEISPALIKEQNIQFDNEEQEEELNTKTSNIVFVLMMDFWNLDGKHFP